MKGYKLAIGIDKNTGPFIVMVVLDIPEDARVVTPTEKVSLIDHPDIIKLRTDKAKVIDIRPLFPEKHQNLVWNGLAFSVHEIRYSFAYTPDMRTSIKTIYKVGETVVSDLLLDTNVSCGQGIHYFNSEEDAMQFYLEDVTNWFGRVFSSLVDDWIWFYNNYEGCTNLTKELMVKLSEMEG